MLQRWWEKKYSLPSNHELFLSRTHLDLLVEFLVDHFEKNPLEVYRKQNGEIQFTNTGDPLIDKWEQAYADGEEIDLMEAFSPEAKERLNKLLKKVKPSSYEHASTFKDTAEIMDQQAKLLKRIKPKISTFGGKY